MIRAATMTNMPPQARFDEALYAVSRERQFTPRLIQARLVSYLQTPCGGLAFGAGILHQAFPTARLWGPARDVAVKTGKDKTAPAPSRDTPVMDGPDELGRALGGGEVGQEKWRRPLRTHLVRCENGSMTRLKTKKGNGTWSRNSN